MASPDCLARLPSTGAFSSWSAATRATQPVRASCNCSWETPAKVREMVVAWGGWSRRKPKGSFGAGRFMLAKRTMWAMVVWPQTKPSKVGRRMA